VTRSRRKKTVEEADFPPVSLRFASVRQRSGQRCPRALRGHAAAKAAHQGVVFTSTPASGEFAQDFQKNSLGSIGRANTPPGGMVDNGRHY